MTGFAFRERPRRNRRSAAIRTLVQESRLSVENLILPLFVVSGRDRREPIASMPGVERLSLNLLLKQIQAAREHGIQAFALFPHIDPEKRDDEAKEAVNAEGLIPLAIAAVKKRFPDCVVFADVALDPYTRHGHDGLVENGIILNDPTVEVLCRMAEVLARAGADYVAPSDMMDGRVGAIRRHLDQRNLTDTGILAYTAKYASAFYGPFREAVGAKLAFGDKRTYQMDPHNRREARREARLDVREGADLIMIKPALTYLDVIRDLKLALDVPIFAYNVSGEYSMIKAAAAAGWLNERSATLEALISIRRAGADAILSYHALDAAKWLKEGSGGL